MGIKGSKIMGKKSINWTKLNAFFFCTFRTRVFCVNPVVTCMTHIHSTPAAADIRSKDILNRRGSSYTQNGTKRKYFKTQFIKKYIIFYIELCDY